MHGFSCPVIHRGWRACKQLRDPPWPPGFGSRRSRVPSRASCRRSVSRLSRGRTCRCPEAGGAPEVVRTVAKDLTRPGGRSEALPAGCRGGSPDVGGCFPAACSRDDPGAHRQGAPARRAQLALIARKGTSYADRSEQGRRGQVVHRVLGKDFNPDVMASSLPLTSGSSTRCTLRCAAATRSARSRRSSAPRSRICISGARPA